MLFSQIPGQEVAKQGLISMVKNGNLPHAIMLVGREGFGGLAMSFALAQYIFCEDKKEYDSCGVCAACNKVMRLEHADLHLSFPAISPKPGTKAMSKYFMQDFREFVKQSPYGSTYDWLQFINAENKQGNITAEECREIIEQLNLKSYEGKGKVQIIWRPEYLGKEGNILLKLIEEPPANTFLILVAEKPEEILPTIKSRTQLTRLAPIPEQDIATALMKKQSMDETRALQIAHMAHGSYTEALALTRQTGNDLFASVRDWFNGLFTNNGLSIAAFADKWSKSGREQQKNFLHYVIQLLEQTIRVRYLPDQPPALPQEESQFVQKLAATQIGLDVFDKMVKEITDTIYYIERNAHSKTQLHALSIRMVYHISGRRIPVL